MKKTVNTFQKLKDNNEKIAMLTAYDYSTAKVLDEAEIDGILVGDSLAMVALGYENTYNITIDEMLIFVSAVARGAKNSFIIGDMPFMSYNLSLEQGLENASRMISAGANAVKLEGCNEHILTLVKRCTESGIPVLAHLGLTPQLLNTLGGYKIQGKTAEQAEYILECAKELQEAGSYDALFKTGFSFDTPEVINLALMKEHLELLKQGETITSPKYDFVTCVSSPDGDVKTPAKVILTEGLYVLNEEIRDVMDVKVYVFTPLDVIKDRWYKRAVSRGKTGEAADLQFKNVNETAQQYIRPTYQIADCIINGMVDKEYIKVITDKILKKLAEICN